MNRLIELTTVFCCLMVLASCDRTQNTDTKTASTTALAQKIGWIHGQCLAINNTKLNNDTQVQLVHLAQNPQVLVATITGRTDSANEGCIALMDDRKAINQNEQHVFYSLKMKKPVENLMAIGLVMDNKSIQIKDGKVMSDINADGINEIFTTCETSEGINFYVWNGEPNVGEPLWSDYYYLGYDLQPTCPQ